MGYGKGIWMGILSAFNIEPTLVSPQRWKKHFGLLGEDKDAARIKALQLYPALMPMLKLKKHGDRADAMLIMLYGRESLGYMEQ
jgi:crossover junction endodeoxyribonuclease RuvC